MERRKAVAIEHLDRQIGRFQELIASPFYDPEKYDQIYAETEYVLRQLFPSEDVARFRDNAVSNFQSEIEKRAKRIGRSEATRYALLKDDSPPMLYRQASEQCLSKLRDYRKRIEVFWDDTVSGTQLESITVQGDFVMRDKHENKSTHSIGDISNSTVSGVALGDNISIISNLNTSDQTGLAQALQTLTDAVLASKDLPADQKEDYVDAINQIGKEATKQKPNKITLKGMIDGLLGTLKAVPDVVQAVTAVRPLLDQLHP
jgi:hypothetical protein